jgi:hypothetical protein
MAETLDRIRHRLGVGALAGFLNGPRAFSFPAGTTIVTVVSHHPPGCMPRFEQVTPAGAPSALARIPLLT